MEKSFVREIWRKATKLSSLKTISGEVTILGDKSISHRCIILGSLAEGESSFENILISGDTVATIEIFRSLGVNIDLIDEKLPFRTILLHSKKEVSENSYGIPCRSWRLVRTGF